MFLFAGLRPKDDWIWNNQSESQPILAMRAMFESGSHSLNVTNFEIS
jgi:hypothetical protein